MSIILLLPAEIWQYRITRYFDGYTLMMWRAVCQFARNNSATIEEYLSRVYWHIRDLDYLVYENHNFAFLMYSKYMINCSPRYLIEIICKSKNEKLLNKLMKENSPGDQALIPFMLNKLGNFALAEKYETNKRIDRDVPIEIFHTAAYDGRLNQNTYSFADARNLDKCLYQNNLKLFTKLFQDQYQLMKKCSYLTDFPNDTFIYYIEKVIFVRDDLGAYKQYLLVNNEKLIRILIAKILNITNDYDDIFHLLLCNRNKYYSRDFIQQYREKILAIDYKKINMWNSFKHNNSKMLKYCKQIAEQFNINIINI